MLDSRHHGPAAVNIVAGLDPAFGGDDRAILQLATIMRPFKARHDCICFHVPIVIPFPTGMTTPQRHLAIEAAKHLRRWNVPPEHVAVDTTGAGQGVWENLLLAPVDYGKTISVVAGASASRTPVFAFETRLAYEMVVNRISESWHVMRAFAACGQLRNMSQAASADFTTRFAVTYGGKEGLESKEDFRARTGRSPDNGDATALCCIAAKEGYGLMPGEHLDPGDARSNFEEMARAKAPNRPVMRW